MATALINIDVPDIAAAERFYTQAFELTLGRRFGADFVELLGWPVPVFLPLAEPGSIGAGPDPRRYQRHWTHLHADVVVDNLDTAVARAVAVGAAIEQPARDRPYGRIAVLADSFGHGFGLIAFNTAGYDALLR
jgi:predicted enzyme related to lactoylglutathione lyase